MPRAGTLGAPDMAEQDYKPGEPVLETGVYRVMHRTHRADHDATLFRNQTFPRCAQCGDEVRYRLAGRAAAIGDDSDFRR